MPLTPYDTDQNDTWLGRQGNRVGYYPDVLVAGSVGYASGAGGTVTQQTSKATGVTLDKICGQITTHSASLANGGEVTFTVTDAFVASTDVPVVAIASGGTSGSYLIAVTAVAAGSFDITLSNQSPAPLAETIVINFAIIKAVSA